MTFVEDDFARAIAEAKRRHVPIFVDAWAPWCHTCLSMRELTLGDPRLSALDNRYVWLAVDTEKPTNAAFVARFPNRVWPTLYVLDERGERALLAWGGSATAEELVALLEDVQGGGARARFAEGAASLASGDKDLARAAFTSLLGSPAADPGTRARAVEALAGLLARARDAAGCVALARRWVPLMPAGSSRAAVLVTALSSLDEADAGEPGTASPALPEQVAWLLEETERAATTLAEPLVPDDRSGLYEALVDHYLSSKDHARVKALASAWASFLEGEAGRASRPALRSVYDAHRVLAYQALGTPERSLPMLALTLRDFPGDGNAHARLARVHMALGHRGEAVLEARTAVALLEGPRSLRAVTILADALEASARPEEASAAIAQVLERVRPLPLTPTQRKLAMDLEARVTRLRSPR